MTLLRAARRMGLPVAIVVFHLLPLQAQTIRGVVVDAAGSPLSEVAVDLWGVQRRLGSAFTARDGRFEFGVEPGTIAVLTVHRIGFRPMRMDVQGGADLTVTMEAIPVALPELVATASRDGCAADDPSARRAWEGAKRRHDVWPTRGGLVARTTRPVLRAVAPESLGIADPAVRVDSGWTGWSLSSREPLLERGYGSRRRPGVYEGLLYGSWAYARLQATAARHFVTDAFGSRVRFEQSVESPAGITVTFCMPRARRTISIAGALTLRPDSSLAAARWRFTVPGTDEIAGGDAVFAPVESLEASLLVPVRGLFWVRERASDRYYQELTEYWEWRVDPDWPEGPSQVP